MNRLLQIVFIALLASILVASAVLIFPAYHKNKSLSTQKMEAKLKLIGKQQDYLKLRQTLSNITSKNEEVERIGREKFNLCKDSETVYKFNSDSDTKR
ncbi:MAG: septum formation initiator family protein [Lentisphaerota bacterium]